MNLAGLKAGLTRNKVALGVLGAAAVAALAWRARSESGTSTSSTTGSTSATTGTAGVSTTPSYYTAGSSSYDSTASDVYNAIQPQLEELSNLVDKYGLSSSTSTTPAEAPTVQGYYRKSGTQAVYEALSDGTRKWLDLAAYDAAGRPGFTDVAATDPLWNRAVTGTDAPAGTR